METTLANQLLIAMPGMADPNFSSTVTLICEHNDEGALGIVEPALAVVKQPHAIERLCNRLMLRTENLLSDSKDSVVKRLSSGIVSQVCQGVCQSAQADGRLSMIRTQNILNDG